LPLPELKVLPPLLPEPALPAQFALWLPLLLPELELCVDSPLPLWLLPELNVWPLPELKL
jgi:hypothetical protein